MPSRLEEIRNRLSDHQGPVPTSALPHAYIDYQGLVAYAESKGLQPSDLSDEEKERFITFYEKDFSEGKG